MRWSPHIYVPSPPIGKQPLWGLGFVTKNWILDLQSCKINMELLYVGERKTKDSFAGYNSTPISCASGSGADATT